MILFGPFCVDALSKFFSIYILQVLSINEGDVIEVGFRGNIKNRDADGIQFVYNSNLESETEFHACEVDKYLQKNFPVYRGVVEVRKYALRIGMSIKICQ